MSLTVNLYHNFLFSQVSLLKDPWARDQGLYYKLQGKVARALCCFALPTMPTKFHNGNEKDPLKMTACRQVGYEKRKTEIYCLLASFPQAGTQHSAYTT